MEWMQASEEKKFIVIGDGGAIQGFSYSHGCTGRATSLVVHHWCATPDYECSLDEFCLYRAVYYAASEVGRKAGWGIYQSAVLPIKDNQRLLGAFESEELRDESEYFNVLMGVTTSGGHIDAAIFTACEDPAEDHAIFEPDDAGIGAPIAGTRS